VYTVVRDHFETFRVESARLRDGDGLPRFVEDEFRAFLRCGFLAGGFARFRCGECKTERLVAFSCKGRGFCPSCGGRRMAERAAHLVDHVVPGGSVNLHVHVHAVVLDGVYVRTTAGALCAKRGGRLGAKGGDAPSTSRNAVSVNQRL
jgi:hypothetical protein